MLEAANLEETKRRIWQSWLTWAPLLCFVSGGGRAITVIIVRLLSRWKSSATKVWWAARIANSYARALMIAWILSLSCCVPQIWRLNYDFCNDVVQWHGDAGLWTSLAMPTCLTMPMPTTKKTSGFSICILFQFEESQSHGWSAKW